MLPILLDKLPEQYNLIVRLHPNIILQHPLKIDTIIEDCADRAEVVFAHDFPPIYPLIDLIDIYIGDASSIGYDVAYMGKPMFLLNQNGRDALKDPGMYLFRCGVEIKKEQYGDIFKIISAYLPSDTSYFHTIRKEVSTYTFTEKKNTDALKDEISKLYHLFPDSDLNFY
jgi:CDP-glycerol glycerophosphotransferase (TagB/SpsB family)